jgi:hypothetical protein
MNMQKGSQQPGEIMPDATEEDFRALKIMALLKGGLLTYQVLKHI